MAISSHKRFFRVGECGALDRATAAADGAALLALPLLGAGGPGGVIASCQVNEVTETYQTQSIPGNAATLG